MWYSISIRSIAARHSLLSSVCRTLVFALLLYVLTLVPPFPLRPSIDLLVASVWSSAFSSHRLNSYITFMVVSFGNLFHIFLFVYGIVPFAAQEQLLYIYIFVAYLKTLTLTSCLLEKFYRNFAFFVFPCRTFIGALLSFLRTSVGTLLYL